jgi:hypothetical protein
MLSDLLSGRIDLREVFRCTCRPSFIDRPANFVARAPFTADACKSCCVCSSNAAGLSRARSLRHLPPHIRDIQVAPSAGGLHLPAAVVDKPVVLPLIVPLWLVRSAPFIFKVARCILALSNAPYALFSSAMWRGGGVHQNLAF